MTKASEIIQKIENFAPPSLASDWDNSGWQVFLGDCQANKVMVALSPTLDVIEQAIAENCRLLITHHPLMFKKINKINACEQTDLTVIKAIQNNIQVYSAHTNLDTAQGGIADRLTDLLNLKNIETFETFVRIGCLEKEENLDDFLEKIKNILDVNSLKVINPVSRKTVRKIAVCPGSGGDMIDKLDNVDLYLTSDIKYHTALEVTNTVVVDAGHYETERIILPPLKELIRSHDIEVLIAEEKSPWKIV
jgi:GTP cyclohydrolase I